MTDNGTTAAQQFYGRWATLYDWLARTTPGLGRLRDRAAAALDLASGDTVVEMGCGTGANVPHLRDRVGPTGRVVGVDFTKEMLDRARRLVRAEGWRNVHLVRGDATETAFRDPPDAMLASFVVGMLADPARAVRDWLDALAPGGRLVLLDAGQSARPYAWPVNQAFRGLVVASSPESVARYADPPWTILDERIETARRALADHGDVTTHEERALGIVRITGGRKSNSPSA